MHATAKVSQHIHDISPSLTLRRDKVYTTYPSSRRRLNIRPPMDVINEIDQSYTWRKLPDISAYKNAIVRNKVCEGIMYLLPSNKNATSLARPYTAELGAMFNEPYHRFKPDEYNEENVTQSSKVHFSPNTYETRLSRYEQVKRNPNDLNNDSKKSYSMYNRLLRKNGRSDGQEGRGNLPIQLCVGQAEQELQQEVEKILTEAEVHEIKHDRHNDDGDKVDQAVSPVGSDSKIVRFQDQQPETSQPEVKPLRKVREFRAKSYERKSANFANYKQLRSAEVPEPQLPVELRSEYLDEQKTQEIWKWLNWDFKKTKFQHFLDVCS